MNFLTAEGPMLARLQVAPGPVEIRDLEGKVIGQFTPVATPKAAFNLELAEKTLAVERGQGHLLAEVMKRLQSLEASG